ncbi:MAG TPA: MFS transporter [Alphaproteobacteria bacterium]|nr:MFS transporter [Alphaproteobacteria bacterium]
MVTDQIGASASGTRDWGAVLLMVASAPCLALIFTATGPILPLIAGHFAGAGGVVFSLAGLEIHGPFYAQLLATLPSFGLIIGGGPSGWLIDRLGVRIVLTGALLLFVLFGSAGLYLDGAVALLLSRFFLGFSAVALGAASISLVGERFDPAGRARLLSWRNILGGVIGVVSSWYSGDIAEIFGFHAVFAMFLVPAILIPVALYALPPRPMGPRAAKQSAADISLAFLWPLYALAIVLSVVMMINATQLPFLLVTNGITTPRMISHTMVLGSLASMAGSVLYSWAGPKLNISGNYTAGAALLGIGVTVLGLSHDRPVAALGIAITGLGAGWVAPHLSRIILDRAPPAARGRAVGLNFSAIYLGDFVNPYIVPPIAVLVGIHNAFILIGGLVALSALQILVPRRKTVAVG